MEQEAHDRLHCWTATDDAPAPVGSVEAGRPLTVVVGVQPMDGDVVVRVAYRVNGGPIMFRPASHVFNDHSADARYFAAPLPERQPGEYLEYGCACQPGDSLDEIPETDLVSLQYRIDITEPTLGQEPTPGDLSADLADRFEPGQRLSRLTPGELLERLGVSTRDAEPATGTSGARLLESVPGLRHAYGAGELDSAEDTATGAILASFANLGLLTDDAQAVAAMVGAGYSSVSVLAATPETVFANRMSGVLDKSVARQLHATAKVQVAVAVNAATAARVNAANGLEQPEHLRHVAEALGSDLGEPCECEECDTAVSPRAYLADLTRYSLERLVARDPSAVDPSDPAGVLRALNLDELSDIVGHPLDDLLTSCEAVTTEVRQARIEMEVMRRYFEARSGRPIPADIVCSFGAYTETHHAFAADVDGDGVDEVIVVPFWNGSRMRYSRPSSSDNGWQIERSTGIYVMKYNESEDRWNHLTTGHDLVHMFDVPLGGLAAQRDDVKFGLAADVDGDGADELVFCIETPEDSGSLFWVLDYQASVRAWRHLGQHADLPFEADFACTIQHPASAKAAIAADVDGDGRDEVIVAPDPRRGPGNVLWVMKYDPITDSWRRLTTVHDHSADASLEFSDDRPGVAFMFSGRFGASIPDGRDAIAIAWDHELGSIRGRRFSIMYFDGVGGDIASDQWRHLLPSHEQDATNGFVLRGSSAACAMRPDDPLANRDELLCVGHAPLDLSVTATDTVSVQRLEWDSFSASWYWKSGTEIDCSIADVGAAQVFPVDLPLDGDHDATVCVVPGPRWDGDRAWSDGNRGVWLMQRRRADGGWDHFSDSLEGTAALDLPLGPGARFQDVFPARMDRGGHSALVVPLANCRLMVMRYDQVAQQWTHMGSRTFGTDADAATGRIYRVLLNEFGISPDALRQAASGDRRERERLADVLGIALGTTESDEPTYAERINALRFNGEEPSGIGLEAVLGFQDVSRDAFSDGPTFNDTRGWARRWRMREYEPAGPFGNLDSNGCLHLSIVKYPGAIGATTGHVAVDVFSSDARSSADLVAHGTARLGGEDATVRVDFSEVLERAPLRGYVDIDATEVAVEEHGEAVISVMPNLLVWRLQRLRDVWTLDLATQDRFHDSGAMLASGRGDSLPIVDPDVIGPADFRVPLASTDAQDPATVSAFDLWIDRRRWVDEAMTELRVKSSLTEMIESMSPLWGAPVPDTKRILRLRRLLTAENSSTHRQRAATVIEQELHLDVAAFLRLADLVLKDARQHGLSAGERTECAAILTGARKRAERLNWIEQERSLGLHLDLMTFWPNSQQPLVQAWPDWLPGTPLVNPVTVKQEHLLHGTAGHLARGLWAMRCSEVTTLTEELRALDAFEPMAVRAFGTMVPPPFVRWSEYLNALAVRLDDGDSAATRVAANEMQRLLGLTIPDFVRLIRTMADLEDGKLLGDAQLDTLARNLADAYTRRGDILSRWFDEETVLGITPWNALCLHVTPWLGSLADRQAWLRALSGRSQPAVIDPDVCQEVNLRFDWSGVSSLRARRSAWQNEQTLDLVTVTPFSQSDLEVFDLRLARALHGGEDSGWLSELPPIRRLAARLDGAPNRLMLTALVSSLSAGGFDGLRSLLAQAEQTKHPEDAHEARSEIAWRLGLTVEELRALMAALEEPAWPHDDRDSRWRAVRKALTRVLVVRPFTELEIARRDGGNVLSRVEATGLDWRMFKRLTALRERAAHAQMQDNDWQEVASICIAILKARLTAAWRKSEQQAGLVLSPDYLRLEPDIEMEDTLDVVPTGDKRWRPPADVANDWRGALQDRRDQAASMVEAYHRSLSAVEERSIPLARDGMLDALPLDLPRRSQRVEWVRHNLFIDGEVDGCATTTRTAAALHGLQSLHRLVRDYTVAATPGNVVIGSNTAPSVLDEEWKWMGTYAAWKATMMVFLYPENVLLPELRDTVTPQFSQLLRHASEGNLSDPRSAQDAAAQYVADVIRISDLSSELSRDATEGRWHCVEVRVPSPKTPCICTSNVARGAPSSDQQQHSLQYLAVISADGERCYVNEYDRTSDVYGFWESLGDFGAKIDRLLGLLEYSVTTDSRYLVLLTLLRRDHRRKVAVLRHDLVSHQWDLKPSTLDITDLAERDDKLEIGATTDSEGRPGVLYSYHTSQPVDHRTPVVSEVQYLDVMALKWVDSPSELLPGGTWMSERVGPHANPAAETTFQFVTGDLDGDKADEVVGLGAAYRRSGNRWAAIPWHDLPSRPFQHVVTADFNGDGRDEIVAAEVEAAYRDDTGEYDAWGYEQTFHVYRYDSVSQAIVKDGEQRYRFNHVLHGRKWSPMTRFMFAARIEGDARYRLFRVLDERGRPAARLPASISTASGHVDVVSLYDKNGFSWRQHSHFTLATVGKLGPDDPDGSRNTLSVGYGVVGDFDGDGYSEVLLGARPTRHLQSPPNTDGIDMADDGLGGVAWVMKWAPDSRQWRPLGQVQNPDLNNTINLSETVAVHAVAGRFSEWAAAWERDEVIIVPRPSAEAMGPGSRLVLLRFESSESNVNFTWQRKTDLDFRNYMHVTSACAGDFDGDGRDELAVGGPLGGIAIQKYYEGRGWRAFPNKPEWSAPHDGVAVAATRVMDDRGVVAGLIHSPGYREMEYDFLAEREPAVEAVWPPYYLAQGGLECSVFRHDDARQQACAAFAPTPILPHCGAYPCSVDTDTEAMASFQAELFRRNGVSCAHHRGDGLSGGDRLRLVYLEEVFFFVPVLAALSLQREGRHAEALRWWRLVFDLGAGVGGAPIYYGFLCDHAVQQDAAHLSEWLRDPMMPHRIAYTRPGSYARFVWLAIADCLLEHADAEYARDTPESVALAGRLYQDCLTLLDRLRGRTHRESLRLSSEEPAIAAADSLAPRSSPPLKSSDLPARWSRLYGSTTRFVRSSSSSRTISVRKPAATAHSDVSGNGRSGTISLGDSIAGPLVAATVDRTWRAPHWPTLEALTGEYRHVAFAPLRAPNFCIPQNPVATARLERVVSRLATLRSCRNLVGMRRQQDYYSAATDVASGMSSLGPSGQMQLSLSTTTRPSPYRFSFLISRARDLARQALDLEDRVLTLYERRDQHELELMDAKKEVKHAWGSLRVYQLGTREALESLRRAEFQLSREWITEQYYADLLSVDELSQERDARRSLWTTALLHGVASGFSLLGAAAEQASWNQGGVQSALAQAASSSAAAASTAAQISHAQADTERRRMEWLFRRRDAGLGTLIARTDVAMAKVRVAIAHEELLSAQLQFDHATDQVEFLSTRFTNAALYTWLLSIVPAIYRQFLRQATNAAQVAAGQLAFELQETPPAILSDYWDPPAQAGTTALGTDRAGMTGSSRLLRDIAALEQFAVDRTRRKLVLRKTISLAQLAPVEFQHFRETGVMSFGTPMDLFDRDYPGHYMRLIRRVRADVVALTPTTEGVHGSLSCSGISRVVTGGDVYQTVVVRRDPETVALATLGERSSGDESNGLREFNEAFEWLGVDTSWEIRMPKASNRLDYGGIADVLLTIDYTALDSYDYRQQVIQRLDRRFSADRAFSFRSDLADAWYDLHNPDETDRPMRVQFVVGPRDFPDNLENVTVRDVLLYFGRSGEEPVEIEDVYLRLYRNGEEPGLGGRASTVDGVISTRRGNAPSLAVLQGRKPFGAWELELPDTEETRMLFRSGQIADILLVITYRATTPAWPA